MVREDTGGTTHLARFCGQSGRRASSDDRYCTGCGSELRRSESPSVERASSKPGDAETRAVESDPNESEHRYNPSRRIPERQFTPGARHVVSDAPDSSATNQKTGMLTVLFSDTRRMGRLRFLFWLVGIYDAMIVIATVAGMGVIIADLDVSIEAFPVIVALAALPVLWNKIVRRGHDINHSGWWTMLLFVPVANFIVFLMLLLKPGDITQNDFGPAPA